ncbi:MAG: sugar phosphate isomerase/epimerase family protein [Parafilimonas sp.]
MNSSRRKFITQSALTIAGVSLLKSKAFSNPYASDHIVGLQLYTVRDDMKNNPENTLKQVAAVGYTHVEHAGYENRKFYGYSPEDFKKLLSDIGLIMLSGHSGLDGSKWDKANNDFTDEWKHTIEDAAAVGMKYVISPGVDESLCKNENDFKWFLGLFNKTGELCKKSGLTFAYHNESYEFNHYLNKVRLYDILLKNTDESIVKQQIDIGNMYGPGGRAMDYLKQYPGRFFSMHVKDEIKSATHDDGYESTILGKGVVGVKEILDYAKKNGGTKQFIIEQESYQGTAPIECSKEDLAMMKKWGY